MKIEAGAVVCAARFPEQPLKPRSQTNASDSRGPLDKPTAKDPRPPVPGRVTPRRVSSRHRGDTTGREAAPVLENPRVPAARYWTRGCLLPKGVPSEFRQASQGFRDLGARVAPRLGGSPPPISQSFRYALTREANSAGSSLASIRARVVTAGESSSKDDSRSSQNRRLGMSCLRADGSHCLARELQRGTCFRSSRTVMRTGIADEAAGPTRANTLRIAPRPS